MLLSNVYSNQVYESEIRNNMDFLNESNVFEDKSFLPEVSFNDAEYMIFCDFDGTYLFNSQSDEDEDNLRELESYISEICQKHKVMIGWVTGSSKDFLLSKIKKSKIKLIPHFIASSLGTEVVMFNQKTGHSGATNDIWQKRVDSDFFQNAIKDIQKEIESLGIKLVPQHLNYSKNKLSFYYYAISESKDNENISEIKRVALKRGISVNINFCSPNVGDPENCYDVDFIPSCCGKVNVIDFLKNQYGTENTKTFAFGDGENDIEMLNYADFGYLVNNATKQAKEKFKNVVKYNSTKGILYALRSFFENLENKNGDKQL